MSLSKGLTRVLLTAGLVAAAACARAQDIYGDLHAPLAGRAYATAIHTADVEELRYVVLRQLTDRYAAAHRIRVTEAEQQAYARRMQDWLRKERSQLLVRRDELTRKLAGSDLPEAQRKVLDSELDGVNQRLAALAADTGPPSAEDRRAREEIAAANILQWKINRALYRQYGGRIIFQQGGPEPLDAYRAFLRERLARGDFAIYDQRMEHAFWRYYLSDSLHSFYPRGSKEEAQAFVMPWWLSK
jgi:hypothetical protein